MPGHDKPKPMFDSGGGGLPWLRLRY